MINSVNKTNKKCPNNTVSYVVRSGDTLFKIASRNKTTIEVLLELNPELNTNLLIPGIVMCVPTEVPAPPSVPVPPIAPPNCKPVCPGDMPGTEMPNRPVPPIAPPGGMPVFPGPNKPVPPIAPPGGMPIPPITPPEGVPVPPIAPPGGLPVYPGPSEIECHGNMRYTIKHGDTLYNIAKKYDITLYDLLNANKNVNPYNLQVGQIICVPVSTTKCPYGKVYTVVAGDTLATILTKFRISLANLKEVNENLDPFSLKAGMKLCIPGFSAFDNCPTERTYVIEKGDNLAKISEKTMISASDILAFNPNMRPEDFADVGVKICLPAEATPYK